MSAAENTAGRSDFVLSELATANSPFANGRHRYVLGTVTGRGKSYRFCIAQTQWFDDTPTRAPAVSFRTVIGAGRSINGRNALQAQREFVLASDFCRTALASTKAVP